jgi:hypothetical protein
MQVKEHFLMQVPLDVKQERDPEVSQHLLHRRIFRKLQRTRRRQRTVYIVE